MDKFYKLDVLNKNTNEKISFEFATLPHMEQIEKFILSMDPLVEIIGWTKSNLIEKPFSYYYFETTPHDVLEFLSRNQLYHCSITEQLFFELPPMDL